jgi:hypothetical protein
VLKVAAVAIDQLCTPSIAATATTTTTTASPRTFHPLPLATVSALSAFLDVAWAGVTQSDSDLAVTHVFGFVDMVFSRNLILSCAVADADGAQRTLVLQQLDRVYDLAYLCRPHIMQYLCARLARAWVRDPHCVLVFESRIAQLLMYGEPTVDAFASSNTMASGVTDAGADAGDSDDGAGAGAQSVNAHITAHREYMRGLAQLTDLSRIGFVNSRFYFLCFFQHVSMDVVTDSPALTAFLGRLMRHLLLINASPDFEECATFGTNMARSKLRLWQALCILSRFLPIAEVVAHASVRVGAGAVGSRCVLYVNASSYPTCYRPF